MGLAVVRRLVNLNYKIAVIDFNDKAFSALSSELGPSVTFHKADVTSDNDLCSVFSSTLAQYHRIDVVYDNAGIGDRINFYAPAKERSDGAPEKPNVDVIDICLMGVVWCAYLSLHYFRQNSTPGGKFVAISSMCGLYPGDGIPLYTAAKHGVVGLCRAIGKSCRLRGEPITANSICPGLVDTGLTGVLMAASPEEYVTPHSTIVRAFEMILDDKEGKHTGLAAECSGNEVYLINHQKWSDDKAEFVMGHGLDPYLMKNGIDLMRGAKKPDTPAERS